MVAKSSELALASICPRALWLRCKYGGRETKIMRKGTARHELFAKDVEKAAYVKEHRSAYLTALLILLLIIFGLGFLVWSGLL